MTLYDYEVSKEISAEEYPFYALVMAVMRQADSLNAAKLKKEWPDIYEELQERYNAPGGFLDAEEMKESFDPRP